MCLHKEWASTPTPFAFQTTVADIATYAPEYREKTMTLSEFFPVKSQCFVMSPPHYGSLAEVPICLWLSLCQVTVEVCQPWIRGNSFIQTRIFTYPNTPKNDIHRYFTVRAFMESVLLCTQIVLFHFSKHFSYPNTLWSCSMCKDKWLSTVVRIYAWQECVRMGGSSKSV